MKRTAQDARNQLQSQKQLRNDSMRNLFSKRMQKEVNELLPQNGLYHHLKKKQEDKEKQQED